MIGLAEKFDREAGKAITDKEDADELARLMTGVRLPEHEPEQGEEQDAQVDRRLPTDRVRQRTVDTRWESRA